MKGSIKTGIGALAFGALAQGAFALASLPFIEDFASNNANWAMSSASTPANWLGSGGVDGGGYISAPATVPSSGGFGFIAFRGNEANNASGDQFVGNWLAEGVNSFSAFVRHNATADLNVYARLDAGFGRAGSSVPFILAPNSWTQISIPITDSPAAFQSYGAGNFTSVFSAIQNIQIALLDTQNPSLVGQSIALDLDQVSIVPEPSTKVLAAGAGVLLFGWMAWSRKRRGLNSNAGDQN